MAVSDRGTRRHSAGVAAARCRHDGDFSGGARGLYIVQLCCMSEASGNKRKLACPSTHGGLKLMQRVIPQTRTMHMCVYSDRNISLHCQTAVYGCWHAPMRPRPRNQSCITAATSL
jgi:hypothetical protein